MGLAITAEQLRRSFGAVEAVTGVDLAVEEGEIYGFLGPNGAGKSTCVRMLCTLLTPTGGRATVAGFDVAAQPLEVRLRIGVALQDAALDLNLTGRELLEVQGRLYGVARRTIADRIGGFDELVDVAALDRRIGTYSGGMRRRLDLAASLIHRPRIVFLDEPTTGLDPASRLRVWEEVRRLNRELGMTIFLTTQYLEEADELADRIGIIDHGRIVAEGEPEALKRKVGSDVVVARVAGDVDAAERAVEAVPGVESVAVHADELHISVADGAATVSPVAVALNDCGVRVLELTLRTPTLDDVFLDLTGGRLRPEERA
jgi:ABC-2 type transport system ATP-binding protein